MPTYEYECTECGHKHEEFQSMSDDPIEKCPKCGGKTKRLISGGAGFLFKGSGFYITDYRSKDYKTAAEKDKPTTISDTKSESKSAAKPDSKSSSKKSSE